MSFWKFLVGLNTLNIAYLTFYCYKRPWKTCIFLSFEKQNWKVSTICIRNEISTSFDETNLKVYSTHTMNSLKVGLPVTSLKFEWNSYTSKVDYFLRVKYIYQNNYHKYAFFLLFFHTMCCNRTINIYHNVYKIVYKM